MRIACPVRNLKSSYRTSPRLCAWLLAALWPSIVSGQAVEEPQTFSDDISILEVEIPVQVLVDGRTLRGLGRADFELLVEGEPQELSWFEAIELDASIAVAGTAPVPAEPLQEPTTESRWRRHYLLFFDFGFSSGPAIERAVDGARRMVEFQRHPNDRLAIVIFGEAVGARIVVPFTSDQRGLELGLELVESLAGPKQKQKVAALEALDAWWQDSSGAEALPAPLLADLGRDSWTLIQPLERPVRLAGLGLPIATGRPGAAEPYRQARLSSILGIGGSLSTLRALGRSAASLVTLLRDVPDPKHMLFLSQGLGALSDAAASTSGLFRLKPMVDAFVDTGWVLHSIDIGGIPAPPASALLGPEDYNSNVDAGLGVVETAGSANNSLFYLANETGGELFEHYNRIHQATEKIVTRTEASYLLAFQPQNLATDGERYEIEVRLVPEIRNARVLHRPSFRAPRPAADRSISERRMDAAEVTLTGRALDELEARFLPTILLTADGARVPIFAEVPIAQLDAGAKRRKKVRLDIHGYAVDESGAVRAGFARELEFRPAGERAVHVAAEIALPEGRYELRMLAWDLRGQRRHLSITDLDVRSASSGRVMLLGPLFVASAESLRRVFPTDIDDLAGLALFDLDDGVQPIDPAPSIVRGRSRRFLLLASGTEPLAEPDLALMAADGTRIVARAKLDRVTDGADGTARFTGLLDTTELAAGRYQLEARLADAVSLTELLVVEPDQSR